MAIIQIEGDLLDELAIKWLYEVADTQVHAIALERPNLGDDVRSEDWGCIQDCIEVLGAVNRLLTYHGKPRVDLVGALVRKVSDV